MAFVECRGQVVFALHLWWFTMLSDCSVIVRRLCAGRSWDVLYRILHKYRFHRWLVEGFQQFIELVSASAGIFLAHPGMLLNLLVVEDSTHGSCSQLNLIRLEGRHLPR
jgi:hypothetical protein